MPSSEKVGVIGLGRMGSAIADNLARAGLLSAVYDKNPDERIEALVAQLGTRGVACAKSPEDLAMKVTLAILSVPHSAVESVLFGHDGVSGALGQGAIVLDGGNSNPFSSASRHEALRELSIHFLDAGLSGGPERAKLGTLAIWVGGHRPIYDRIQPVLQVLGKPEYVGGPGAGHTYKLWHNMVEHGMLQAYAEVANLIQASGHNPHEAFRRLKNGLIDSTLLTIFLSINEEDVCSQPPNVEGGEYTEWGRKIASGVGAPIPAHIVAGEARKLSRSEQTLEEAQASLCREMAKLQNVDSFRYGFQFIGAVRKAFGGHK